MTTRPLIAVPAMRSARIEGMRRDGLVASERIVESIFRAGGEPVVFYAGDCHNIARRLTPFAGVLLPGGRDVDPRRYGADDLHALVETPDRAQDDADLAIAASAVAVGMPILAICRGLQVLNVALGGTLVQHLPPSSIDHRDSFHDVTLEPGCDVAVAMRAEVVSVSSYHHQALDRIAIGLRVVGTAEDGCPEVVAHDCGNVLAVQWHPEDNAHEEPKQQALFDRLVAKARAFAEQGRSGTLT